MPRINGIGPQDKSQSGRTCFPIQSPKIDQSASSVNSQAILTKIFGILLCSKCRPHLGANPVNAVARADNPDSRLVIKEVQELEKQTALDSAQEAMPESNSIPLS